MLPGRWNCCKFRNEPCHIMISILSTAAEGTRLFRIRTGQEQGRGWVSWGDSKAYPQDWKRGFTWCIIHQTLKGFALPFGETPLASRQGPPLFLQRVSLSSVDLLRNEACPSGRGHIGWTPNFRLYYYHIRFPIVSLSNVCFLYCVSGYYWCRTLVSWNQRYLLFGCHALASA